MDYLNSYLDKEQTEWSNFWYDQANTQGGKRILMVGDSVARGARRSLSETLKCPVDLFGSSAALRDQMYWDQWECFFKNNLYQYDAVFVWVGNHSRISEDGKSFFTEYDYKRFQTDFNTLIDKALYINPKVIVLTTLHIYKWRKYNNDLERVRRKLMIKPKEEWGEVEDNIVVEGKNRIMQEVAEIRKLTFCDIDKMLMQSRYWHVDFIHYIPEANKYIASILKSLL